MKKTIGLAAAIALAFSATPALAAKYYKWVDASGATHYTEEPPPADAKTKAGQVKISGPRAAETEEPAAESATATAATTATPAAGAAAPARPAAAAPKARDEGGDKEKDKKPAAANERYAEKCKQLRSNLQAMEEHGRVKESDDKGNVRVLTDEEKNERMDATQRQIKAFCE